MTDKLDEMLADLRESAIREIRPPGVAAARRTVRRRRVTGVVATACAVVLAIAGGVALAARPAEQGRPVVAASSSDVVEVARQRLADDRTPAIEAAAPVTAGYSAEQEKQYLGNLTLRLACAGQGRITLLVQSQRNDLTPWQEIARVGAECAADPVPAETLFAMSGPNQMYRFQLVDAGQAAGRSGFAYRVTGDTGEPVDADFLRNKAIDPYSAIKRNGRTALNGGTMRFSRMEPDTVEGPGLRNGRYRLAVACAGWGSAIVEVHQRGKIVASTELVCDWPASQKEIDVGRLDEMATLSMGYRSGKPADALIAWGWFRD